MDKNFEAFLDEFSKQKQILCSPELFKLKLEMSADTYEYLTKAESLKDFLGALASMATGGGIGAWTWWSSASILTKALVLGGIVSFPPTYPLIGGATALAAFLGLKKFSAKKKELVKEVPEFTTAPIDFLASTWLDILMPILVKMAVADGKVHAEELETIKNNLTYKWGYCKEVVEDYLNKTLNDPKLQNFDYESVVEMIKTIANSDKGLDKKTLVGKILEEVKDVMRADEREDPEEKKEYFKLKSALGKLYFY